jgi:hypothetical protein
MDIIAIVQYRQRQLDAYRLPQLGQSPQVRNLTPSLFILRSRSPHVPERIPSGLPLILSPPLTSPSFHPNMLTIYYSLTAALLLVPAAAQIFYPVCSSSWSWVRDLQLNNPISQRILQNLPYSSRSTPSGRVPAKSLGFCRVYVTTEVRSPILG